MGLVVGACVLQAALQYGADRRVLQGRSLQHLLNSLSTAPPPQETADNVFGIADDASAVALGAQKRAATAAPVAMPLKTVMLPLEAATVASTPSVTAVRQVEIQAPVHIDQAASGADHRAAAPMGGGEATTARWAEWEAKERRRAPKAAAVPWQCLQYDPPNLDDWCGREKIKTHFGDLSVVNRFARAGDYSGCAKQCLCCMESWLSPGSEVLPRGRSPAELRRELWLAANRTFARVLGQYSRPLRLKLAGASEYGLLRKAMRGSVALQQDLELSLGRVRRNHILRRILRRGGDTIEVVRAADMSAELEEVSGMVAEFDGVPEHCPKDFLGLFPAWSAALQALAVDRAINGTLHFTLTDKTYESAMPCWDWSIRALTGRENTLIIPTDDIAIAQCKRHRLPCVLVATRDLPKIKIWGDIGFIKFYAMALISSLGLDFIFSEMDVLILQDPWPYHEHEDPWQWRKGDCRHYPHTWPGRGPRGNSRAEDADIHVPAHYNHPRVNIGYIYARWTPETMHFFLQLHGYFAGKCPDTVLGWNHPPGTYIDLGLPDQNILDAMLRNHDHGHPKYHDIPWETLPAVRWKLLDYNLFGIWGRHDAPVPWVTFHYAGEGRKVTCWRGICERMRQERAGRALRSRECIRPWQGGRCSAPREGSPRSLQGALEDACLGVQIGCSVER